MYRSASGDCIPDGGSCQSHGFDADCLSRTLHLKARRCSQKLRAVRAPSHAEVVKISTWDTKVVTSFLWSALWATR